MRFPLRVLLLGVFLAALAAGGWFMSQGLICVAYQDEHLIPTGQLMGNSRIGQVFYCDQGNLTRVETRMGTYGSWSNSSFEFGLVELDQLPKGRKARFGPQNGMMIRLEKDWAITTLLEAKRPDGNGLELLVSKPKEANQGELVVAVVPWEPGHLDLTPPLIFRRPLKKLSAHGPVRFKFPARGLDSTRPLMVVIRVEGALTGTYLGLHWRPFPAVHLPQILEKPNRFWQAFRMDYLGRDENKSGAVYPGQLILRLTYPPQVPFQPLVRSKVEKAAWVSDNTFHPISFEPITNSKNKTYHYFIQAPQASLSDALTLWAHRRAGPKRFMTEDGTPVDGALSFRAYVAVSKAEAMNLFTARLNEGKKRAWLSGWMIIPAVLIQILIMAGVLAYLVGRRRLSEKRTP